MTTVPGLTVSAGRPAKRQLIPRHPGTTRLTQIDLFCATLASMLDNGEPRRTAATCALGAG